jgi:hypothetical protein
MGKANRAETHLSIHNEVQFSQSIVDHFQWFKLHWFQHIMNYTQHSMDLKNGRFESLPMWRAEADAAVSWSLIPAAGILYAFKWRMNEDSWLRNACKCSNPQMPLLVHGESRVWKGFYSWCLMAVESSQWCPSHDTSKKTHGVLGVFAEKDARAKNARCESEWFSGSFQLLP